MFERCLDKFIEQLEPILSRMDRGGILDPAEVERITGQPCSRLEGRIKGYFWRQGKSMVRRNGALCVLTDDEEAEYAVRDATRSKRSIGRGVHRLGGLDRSKLKPDSARNIDLLVKELTVVKEAAAAAVKVMSRALSCATQPTRKQIA